MKNISVIGSGYIGLVVGNCLASFGNKITFADIDQDKVDKLNKGICPIYEPGLEELINKNLLLNQIEFTTNIAHAIQNSKVIFIAVNTPEDENGRADISAVKKVASDIAKYANEDKIICIKSTVPVGTHKIVQDILESKNEVYKFDIVSIPEFLREGSAINDFLNPDRIIIGTQSVESFNLLKNIFSGINCQESKIIHTNNSSAETIKYVSNSFLALKVSFINEIANLCDLLEVDVEQVVKGVGLDNRIGNQFLKPGPGFGGSCFPKDILALCSMAKDAGYDLLSVNATLQINKIHKQSIVKRILNLLGKDFANKTVGILGLAFKANTDDIRQSPALDIIKDLHALNLKIKAHDPKANENMQKEIPKIEYCADAYKVAQGADILVVLTEWQEFANLDFVKIFQLMKSKTIFDTRNILNSDYLNSLGFKIEILGRSMLNKD